MRLSIRNIVLSTATMVSSVAIAACALLTSAPTINAAPVTGSSSLSSSLDVISPDTPPPGEGAATAVDTADLTTIAQENAGTKVAVRFVRVIDGDTIVVYHNGEQHTVRMIGIDSPESKHPTEPVEFYGVEAAENLEALLANARLTLEFDPTQDQNDNYGRLLAYVWFTKNGTERLANLEQIASGSAEEYSFDDRYVHRSVFIRAQELARINNLGLWAE